MKNEEIDKKKERKGEDTERTKVNQTPKMKEKRERKSDKLEQTKEKT